MLPSIVVDRRAISELACESSELARFVSGVSSFGPVVLEVRDWSDRNTLDGLEMLPGMLNRLLLCISGFGRDDLAVVTQLLDAGMRVGFFEARAVEDVNVEQLKALPPARVGVRMPMEALRGNAAITLAPLKGLVHHLIVLVRETPTVTQLNGLRNCASELHIAIILQLQSATIDQLRTYNGHGLIVSCPVMLQFRESRWHNPCDPLSPGLDILSAFLSTLTITSSSGSHGSSGGSLGGGGVTTVVCDKAGVALGVVTSNRRSLQASLETGECVFWSRPRNRLWKKRNARIVALRADCSGQTIRCTIAARGEQLASLQFCHLDKHTCWGELSGLTKLQQQLHDKAQRASSNGSYTASLFKNTDLLEQRMVEEVHAMVKAEAKDDVASKAADVVYLLMTRCAAAGVSLDDVVEKLDLRALKVSKRKPRAELPTEQQQQQAI